jgi:hypothetical protein
MTIESKSVKGEAIVYYTLTVAVHIDLDARGISRVVELREEIRRDDSEPIVGEDLSPVSTDEAVAALRVAESRRWPASWEFGY